jgi:hypothetical protein
MNSDLRLFWRENPEEQRVCRITLVADSLEEVIISRLEHSLIKLSPPAGLVRYL